MTKVIYNHRFPAIDRDEFLTPFDRMFDQIINTQFPEIEKQVGVKPFSGTAYPKVNVDRKSTRLNSSHGYISYAVFSLKKKIKTKKQKKKNQQKAVKESTPDNLLSGYVYSAKSTIS